MNNITGEATNTDEYTPTTTPTFMANAKLRTSPVPKMFIMIVTANSVSDVSSVRAIVSLSEILTTRDSFLVLEPPDVLPDAVEDDHRVVH